MNNKLENILKRGMIETLEEAELFWDKAYIEIVRSYKYKEKIHARLHFFGSSQYYAQITCSIYERTPSNLVKQPIEFYVPGGKVSTYEELLEAKKNDAVEYLFDKFSDVDSCIRKGCVDTEEKAKWFLSLADSIYSTGGNSINIRSNLFKMQDYYCEITGMKIFNKDTREIQYIAIPGKIRYYSPDGEEKNYMAVEQKLEINTR